MVSSIRVPAFLVKREQPAVRGFRLVLKPPSYSYVHKSNTCPKIIINSQFRVCCSYGPGGHTAYALNMGQTVLCMAFIWNASLMP